MASVAVDKNGSSITTDILVSGHVRNCMKEYAFDIPDEIIGILFIFWFIPFCDEWERSLIDERVKIDKQCATLTDNGSCTLFGSHSVDAETFTWKLKFNTTINWITIGVIKDSPDILEAGKNTHCFGFNYNEREEDHGCIVTGQGKIYCNCRLSQGIGYTDPLSAEGTIVEITLNMSQHSVTFKVNDKDYGVGTDQLHGNKYRLVTAVTLNQKNSQIELL